MQQTQKAVLIAGAGPTGMTAAMELSRFGIPVRLVDRMPAPQTTSRALAVQARTLELFEQRGLTEEMLGLGNRVFETAIMENGKQLFGIDLSGIESRYNFILMLSQAKTERILREQLARQGVTIERPVELIAIAQSESATEAGDAGDVRAVLRHADGCLEEIETPYLICAEGAHSSVRHTLDLQFAGTSMEQTYSLADLYVDGPIPERELSIYLSSLGFLGLFPMGNRHFRLIASEAARGVPAETKEPSLEEMQRVFDLYSGVNAELRDMVWSSRFHISTRMLKSLRSGSVFFGGDTAHVHSPAGGQGMNTGIQDMIDLGWKMALVLKGKAARTLLDTYGQDRIPVIKNVLNVTERMTQAVQGDSRIVNQLIGHLAPLLFEMQAAQRKSTSTISQIGFDYRESRLSKTDAHAGRLKAGDRLPELEVIVRSNGESRACRLQEIADPTGFTLLVTSGTGEMSEASMFGQAALQPWQRLMKTVPIGEAEGGLARKHFKDSFGEESGMFLVRPDAYLGFVGGQSSGGALLEWLNEWFPVKTQTIELAEHASR